MKSIQGTIGMTVMAAALALTPGCDTTTGALSGAAIGGGLGAIVGAATGRPGLGAAIGATAGAVTGSIIGHINAEQRERLRRQSPQTLATIQHNDQVIQQQQQAQSQAPQPQPAATQSQSPPAQSVPPQTQTPETTLTPLTVDDIKALNSAGVKKDVIIAEIEKSKSTFTRKDIDSLQQANPNIDPAVIASMKKTIPG